MEKYKQKIEQNIGFNRYMVECEYFNMDGDNSLMGVLIDTWWNVNSNKLGAGVEAVEF